MKGYNWDIGVRNCAFKVDIQKAYDTVNWKFLEFCLKEFGFHPVMIHWIMTCLTSASFSVCVNGETHGFFRAKRGLRQGDPISPYLFTLVMEVLNLMIKRHIRNDKRFKYHPGCQKLEISSLYFTDDLLMLCHGDMVSASILRRGLDKFSMSSGMYPSMSKSNAFFCNIPPDIKDEIKLVMPFNEGVLPIRYLGVPLVSKTVTKNDCRILMEVIQNKVNSWKNKFLSFVGRLQLITSVLSAMQVYWCSLFIFPFTVCDDIDSLMSNFLWSNKDGIGSMVSVKWSDVCKPKNQGGLGLKSMHEWNISLMAKHLWSIISNKNTIWVKWVKVHKLKGNIELNRGMSWSWKHLLNLRDKIKEFVNVKLGNGKNCSLWFDKWHPGGPLSKLIDYRMIHMAGLDINAKVIDLINNNSWCWPIDWVGKYDSVLNVPVPILVDDLEDKPVWCNKKGKEKVFNVSEVWKAIKVEYPKVTLKLILV
ncbi:RNA-directed DNA polymerase, eukaryota, reverse transcriptase zinc-binding domain protein [Tanacetum coccineum]